MVTLSLLPINSCGIIKNINIDFEYKNKLSSSGCIEGSKVRVQNIDFYDRTITINITKQYGSITLLFEDAKNILVLPL